MDRMTPREEARHSERSERLRRDRMRSRRQRVLAVAAVLVLAIAGTALAMRPADSPRTAAPASGSAVAATLTAETSAAVETSPAVETSAAASDPATQSVEPTPSVAATPTIKPLKPAPGVKTIVVDKSEQRVTVYKANGTGVDTFRCSSGVIYPRVGTYKVYGRRTQSWSLYDNTTFFYFTMFVKSDKGNNIGFHSIPQTPDGKLVGKLGKPVSHGCVRLDKKKAKFIYTWAVNGTRVVVKK